MWFTFLKGEEMNQVFTIERLEHVTKITNYSDMNLLIFETPMPPKRKLSLFLVIQPEQFRLLDFPIDLTRINFRLEKNLPKNF
jgi:hypothetical protein